MEVCLRAIEGSSKKKSIQGRGIFFGSGHRRNKSLFEGHRRKFKKK